MAGSLPAIPVSARRDSNIAESANVQRLRAAGIPVAIGHAAENLGAAQVVVMRFSSAPPGARHTAPVRWVRRSANRRAAPG